MLCPLTDPQPLSQRFHENAGNRTQVFVLGRQALYPLHHLDSPPYRDSFPETGILKFSPTVLGALQAEHGGGLRGGAQ